MAESRSERWKKRQKSREEDHLDDYLIKQGNDIEDLTLKEKRQLYKVLKESEEAYSAEQQQRYVWEDHEKLLSEKNMGRTGTGVQEPKEKGVTSFQKTEKESSGSTKRIINDKTEICDGNIEIDLEKENAQESESSNRSSPEIIEITEDKTLKKHLIKNSSENNRSKRTSLVRKSNIDTKKDESQCVSKLTNSVTSKSENNLQNTTKSSVSLSVKRNVKKSCSETQQGAEISTAKNRDKLRVKKKVLKKKRTKAYELDFSSSEEENVEEFEKRKELGGDGKVENNKASKHSVNKENEITSLCQEKRESFEKPLERSPKGKPIGDCLSESKRQVNSTSACRVEETDEESDVSTVFDHKTEISTSVTEVPETMEHEENMSCDEDETQDMSKCSPDIFGTTPTINICKPSPSPIEIDSPELDCLLTPGQSVRETESVSILKESAAESSSPDGNTEITDQKGQDTQAFEVCEENEKSRARGVRKRSREDEPSPKKVKKQKVIFDFMIPKKEKSERTSPPKIELKSRLKQRIREKHPYFAPPGEDPCKYTKTIVSYLNQYEVDFTKAQNCIFPCIEWPPPIKASYPFPKKEEKESRRTPLSDLEDESSVKKETAKSDWKRILESDSQHFKPIGRATRSKKQAEENEDIPDLGELEETQDYDIEEVSLIKPIPCFGKQSGDKRNDLSNKDKNSMNSKNASTIPRKMRRKQSDENIEESQNHQLSNEPSPKKCTQSDNLNNSAKTEKCEEGLLSRVRKSKSKTPEIDSDSNEGVFVLSGQATMEEDYVVQSDENDVKVETPTKRFFKSRHKNRIEPKYEAPGLFEDIPERKLQTSKRGRGGRGRGRGRSKNISPTNTTSKRKTPVKINRISPAFEEKKDDCDQEVTEILSEEEDPIPKNVKAKSRSPVILGKHKPHKSIQSSNASKGQPLSSEDKSLVKTLVDGLLHPQEKLKSSGKNVESETPSPIIMKEIPGTSTKDAVACPLCGRMFPSDEIMRHASDCGTEVPSTRERIVPSPRPSIHRHWLKETSTSTPDKSVRQYSRRTPTLRSRSKMEETEEEFNIVDDDSDYDQNWKPENTRKTKKRGTYHFATESDSDESIEIISKKPKNRPNSRPTTPVMRKGKNRAATQDQDKDSHTKVTKTTSQCPVCQAIMFQDLLERHVDECLQKQEKHEPKMLRPNRGTRAKTVTKKVKHSENEENIEDEL